MDRNVPWIGLEMRLDSLEALPRFELPGAYGWRYFRPGDEREAWAPIEISAGEFEDMEGALRGKAYHRFGFRPFLRAPQEAEGWRIVSEKSGIDFTGALNGR